MQNAEIEKASPWNPWHGCKKASPGCKNCFVYKMDKQNILSNFQRLHIPVSFLRIQ